ncbi:PQQ-binding-like beta-propeller repeat protein [Flagellimonas olearia]|uniref:PQQ-binding-like beta-propeller repeat protein n=1 Tax=Flagellimonas olearia TaxID=552546 RepID=A0A6I1EBN2_9FLAO|nr:PQQ-binding-like beta-propeller repeat protein [Allomuricauda olearia]KAB7531184.1 PQQ-binding-like beta-propeller repeat protein [Allomuricauda olearia]
MRHSINRKAFLLKSLTDLFSIIFFLSITVLISSCNKDEIKSSDNSISKFQLQINGNTYSSQINSENGKITIEFEGDLPTSLTPIIEYSNKATIIPNPETPQDFNNIVRYTVTAENGLERYYTVVVNSNLGLNNSPPGEMQFLGVEFIGREFTIDWTDAEDSDAISYIVYKNEVKVGELSESEITIPYSYNSIEKIIIFATDKNGGTSKLEVDIETPTSELLFVKNFSGVLYAIDTKLQDILWVGKSLDNFYAPVFHENKVLSSWDKKLIGLDLLTGKEVQVYDSITSNNYSGYADPLVDNDLNTIYFKEYGSLYSINSKDGSENWKTYVSNISSTITPSTMTESHLYTLVGRRDILFSINKFNGSIEWQYNLKSFPSGAVPFYRRTPIVIGQSIIFGDDGNVYSLNKDTGEENWVLTIRNPSSFTFYNQQLIVMGLYAIYGINPINGSILWEKELTWGTVSTPFLENETLYMGITGNGVGSIIALDANNGNELWKRDVSGSVVAAPVVFENKLYVCHNEGTLLCLDATSGNTLWQMTIGDYVITSPSFVKGNGDIIVYPNIIGFN